MITGTQLKTYCYQLEKIGYEIGRRAINEEQKKELKKAYENGLNKGIAAYEESAQIMAERDMNDFINS
jgi:hypothetical protein|nr:MAG TPA: hypothetical protein [Herelleviridae sp.]